MNPSVNRGLPQVMAALTGPEGEYALRTVHHHGVPVDVFAGGAPSLTEAFGTVRPGLQDAIVFGDERLSVDELIASTTRIAAALRTRYGVARGDRIAIAMRNYPEWVLTFWASQLVGAVVVPLNAWSTGAELKVQLDHARPAVIFADRERLQRLGEVYGDEIAGTTVVRIRSEPAALASVPLVDLIEHDLTLAPITPPSTEDTATVLYTSGTTGRAKGVVGTHLNHVNALRGLQLRAAARALIAEATVAGITGEQPEARALVTFPFFHVAGLAMLTSCVVAGKPMVLMYKWDPDEAVRLVDRERITELYGPPVVVRDLLAAAAASGQELPTLRLTGSGGSVTSPSQVERVRRLFGGRVLMSNAYGLTETTGTVVTQAGQDVFDHPDCLGRPIPGVRVQIVDPNGEPVPPGEIGEIQVYGSVVSPGYLDDPEATAESFAAGWFRTGDLGSIDADGLVRLRGRLKDVIIRGGENIACAEVERVIDEYPSVLESAVLGRPDAVMGEAVVAVVRAREGVVLDVDALTGHVRERLAAHKVPTAVILTREPLPRTATGKILKGELNSFFTDSATTLSAK